MTSKVTYTGGLHTEAVHIQSSVLIHTDAPVDNQGKGETFSPSDLTATSLASCMLTIIGIAAGTHGFNIDGSEAEVTKIMSAAPRKIAEIQVNMHIKGQASYSDKERAIIERSAHTCPVALSLHPDIKQTVQFSWG